ncbi:uncharacterized protein erg28 isoform X3 [Hypanus sabinus]|uniref:uncharacterized protein erg28 isoform X3 n=1 Tax=Hypanus sabinus TaxID=79690 RepID=UPI0028C3FB7B|nr:uncharacterized protein erg28 isoform X3 [Hypanus sabinus]
MMLSVTSRWNLHSWRREDHGTGALGSVMYYISPPVTSNLDCPCRWGDWEHQELVTSRLFYQWGHSILRQRPLVLNSPTRGNILSTRMSRFLNVLRSWLVMVAVIAAGNTIQSFRDHSFLSEKLYTGKPALDCITSLSGLSFWLSFTSYPSRSFIKRHP